MEYIKRIPETPSFSKGGMNGYSLNLENKNISIRTGEWVSYEYEYL